MPSLKTECSELSVAFGLLNEELLSVNTNGLDSLFESTLSLTKYASSKTEYLDKYNIYERMVGVGKSLRENYGPLNGLSSLKWLGPTQQATTTTMAKDLLAGTIPISIKLNSNVVTNFSPYNLFISVPTGGAPARGSTNWYLEKAPGKFQAIYSFARDRCPFILPTDVSDFERNANGKTRRALESEILKLTGTDKEQFSKLYIDFSHEVASESAATFNTNLASALRGRSKNAVIETVCKAFFRMNATEYLICGLDKNVEFGMMVPDLTTWKRNWKLNSILASGDMKREQPRVNIEIKIQDKRNTSNTYSFDFHAEVRWSHGKFRGKPEAKLYKDFVWNDVPFFNKII